MLSDSDSSDSDNGIRFKTASTRNKEDHPYSVTSSRNNGSRERGRIDSSHATENRIDRERRRSQDRRHRSNSREDGRRRNRSNSHDRGSRTAVARDADHSNRDRSSKSEKDISNREKRDSRDREMKDRGHVEHTVATIRKSSHERSSLVDDKREKSDRHMRDDHRDRKDLQTCRSTTRHNDDDRQTARRHSERRRSGSSKIRDQTHSRSEGRQSGSSKARERSRDLHARENSTRFIDDDYQTYRHGGSRRRSGSGERISEPVDRKVNNRYDATVRIGAVDKNEKAVIVLDNDEDDDDDNDEDVEKHKSKKVKHKKHKRSRREDNGIEAAKSNDNEKLSSVRNKTLSPDREKKHDRHHHSHHNQKSNSVCGPSFLPHSKHSRSHSSDRKDKLSVQRILDSSIPLGPALPPSFSSSTSKSAEKSSHSERRNIGPALPSHMLLDQHAMSDISDEDDDLIGPVPIGAGTSEAHLELEKRALELKLARYAAEEDQEKLAVREEWMIELPDVKAANLGLGARQFRTKERPDFSDRSSWTDTPKERERKSHHSRALTSDEIKRNKKREGEVMFTAKRDAEQEEAVKRHSKKHRRDESLLETHQKKLKKKREKEPEKPTRRPFDRDTDLKVNRFDQAQKNSILKKAQLLDNRFGSGESKFL